MKIAVIANGDKKDFIRNLPEMAEIHKTHKNDNVLLVCNPENADLAGRTGYFNKIWAVHIPGRLNIISRFLTRQHLRSFNCDTFYNLSANNFFKIDAEAAPQPKNTDNSWINGDLSFFQLPKKYAVIDLHNNGQTIAPRRMAALVQKISFSNISAVFIGGAAENDMAETAKKLAPNSRNLCGQLNEYDIGVLARDAQFWIGYNTASAYLAGLAGCKILCLYGENETTDKNDLPPGKNVVIFQSDLADLSVGEIYKVLTEHEFL